MKGNLRAPIWMIPVLVLVMAIGAFAVAASLSHFAATPAEATDGGFKVELDNIVAGEASGYTITFKSDNDFTSFGTATAVTIIFPVGTDLSPAGVADAANYSLGDGEGTGNNADPAPLVAVNVGARSITLTAAGDIDNDSTTNSDGSDEDPQVLSSEDKGTIDEGDSIVVIIDAAAGILNQNLSTDTLQLKVDTGDGNGADAGTTCSTTAKVDGCSGNYGSGVTVAISPNDPGQAARITITFIANNQLNPGDEIIILFEDDWGVPSTMSSNLVTLRASDVTNDGDCTVVALPGCPVVGVEEVGGKFSNTTIKPDGIRIDFVGSENDEGEVSLQVPDMNTEDGSAVNSIAAGALVTVIFLQSEAGIINPTEALENSVDISTSVNLVTIEALNADTVDNVVTIARIELSDVTDDRGSRETLIAIGVEGNESITFFLDNDGDGIRDSNERDLCTVVADGDDTASCEIVINNPPFFPGDFGPGTEANPGNCTLPVLVECNFINFVDSENRSTGAPLALTQEQVDRQVFELEPTVNLAPSSANVGDTITVSLFDFPSGVPVDKILIGKLDVTPDNLPNTGGSGEVSFGFKVPGVANNGIRIPIGKRRFDVFAGGADNDANLTISGANLSLSHETVVANQDLTISGNGFSEGNNVCIVEGQITIGNVPVEIDDDNDCPQSVLDENNAEEGILLTSGGTFTITVRVHDPDGSSPALSTSLLNEATHELKIIDTNGAEGSLLVTIAERSLVVTPAAARPRDVITIIGRNFIADNPDGLSTTVDIEYECGSSSRTVTADPDVSGNFRETLRIPSGCAIPSTNTLTARISANGNQTGVVETITHEIPEGLITIEPGRGASGTRVTVRGVGFRTFETVEKIEFGGLGTLGGRTVNTDANGDFVVEDLLVPGLDPGIHAVKVEVSTGSNRTTSSTSFEILESGLIGQPTPVADVYDMSDSLLRIFRFDNSTKVWAFNDKREEFTDANTLDELISGGVYWILIDQDVTLDVQGVLMNLTCTGGDCWNLVVWP